MKTKKLLISFEYNKINKTLYYIRKIYGTFYSNIIWLPHKNRNRYILI